MLLDSCGKRRVLLVTLRRVPVGLVESQLHARANFHVRIGRAQLFDFIQVDSFAITIVIGESDIGQILFARAVDPWWEQLLSKRLNAVALGMGVVIGK